MIGTSSARRHASSERTSAGSSKRKTEVQELRQPANPAAGMQGKVETVTVANDHSAVVIALRRVRVEPKVLLVENPTALRVTNRQTEMEQVHVPEHALLHSPDDQIPPLAGVII
jgi:hypothetical protein